MNKVVMCKTFDSSWPVVVNADCSIQTCQILQIQPQMSYFQAKISKETRNKTVVHFVFKVHSWECGDWCFVVFQISKTAVFWKWSPLDETGFTKAISHHYILQQWRTTHFTRTINLPSAFCTDIQNIKKSSMHLTHPHHINSLKDCTTVQDDCWSSPIHDFLCIDTQDSWCTQRMDLLLRCIFSSVLESCIVCKNVLSASACMLDPSLWPIVQWVA